MTILASVLLSSSAVKRGAPFRLVARLKSFWRDFFTQAFDPYRPEQHYMRGPGPAWRAKYGAQATFRLKSDLD